MICVATIVSANYLAYAKTLYSSIIKNHIDVDFRVLLVDRKCELYEDAVLLSKLNVTFAEELNLDDFEQLAFKYDLVELNTALKPTFLKYLFNENKYQKIIYLDPDIRLFSPLTPVLNALSCNDIVLTPHTLKPVMDGLRPSDIDFLRAGAFNLGFIGLKRSDNSFEMLDWWEKRCLAYGFIDPGFGIFVDQKWANLVPCYFNGVNILKHPGCNVAYWNLHERNLTFNGEILHSNGEPVCFFHFSGVKATSPDFLSRHQSRHNLNSLPVVKKIVNEYCSDLISNKHEYYSKLKYSFGFFDDGLRLNTTIRRAATFMESAGLNPFDSKGVFYKELRQLKLIEKVSNSPLDTTTLNFSQEDKKVVVVNKLIRILNSILGLNKVSKLLRYFTVLNQQANLLRVITKTPLDFTQTEQHSRNKLKDLASKD